MDNNEIKLNKLYISFTRITFVGYKVKNSKIIYFIFLVKLYINLFDFCHATNVTSNHYSPNKCPI